MSKHIVFSVVLVVLLAGFGCPVNADVRAVKLPSTEAKNDFYVGNRPPLLPSPFVKLPIGAIKPAGWVRRQLELQADGFHGLLTEISDFLMKEKNALLAQGIQQLRLHPRQ